MLSSVNVILIGVPGVRPSDVVYRLNDTENAKVDVDPPGVLEVIIGTAVPADFQPVPFLL